MKGVLHYLAWNKQSLTSFFPLIFTIKVSKIFQVSKAYLGNHFDDIFPRNEFELKWWLGVTAASLFIVALTPLGLAWVYFGTHAFLRYARRTSIPSSANPGSSKRAYFKLLLYGGPCALKLHASFFFFTLSIYCLWPALYKSAFGYQM